MASKYERITDLYLQTAGEVATQEYWPRFLKTACYNFRLSFDKQILLYAQCPDATAVLPIEGRQGWNQRFGRWVNRGSKGIAILDSDSNGQARIKYYFDIADTHEGRHPHPVPIWTVRPEQEQAIMETLVNSFGVLGNTNTLGDALLLAASNAMEDNFQDYLAQLIYYKEGSFLEPLDEESLETIFEPLLQNSIGYMLLVRCGIDPSEHFTPEDFSYISGFNTLQTINVLGTATSDISQMCLSEIARTALSLQRQQNRTFEEPAENEYAVVENQTERSMNHDTDHIHEAGGLSASQPSPAPGTTDSPWEVRIDAPQIPDAEPERDLHEPFDHGSAPQSPDGDRADSPEPGGADRQPDGESGRGDGGAESHRPDEVGGPDEQLPLSSGGADPAGIDLRIDGIIPPPSVEEQISFLGGGYLAPEQDDEQQTFFTQPQLPQQVIDEALCIGFNDKNSRLIICAHYMKDKPLEENAAFLQKSYGTNGAGLFIQDREYAIWYDADGIRIATGRTVQKRYTTLITWEQAAKRIRELLDLGRYMPQSELDRVQDFERLELAKSLIYARREFSDEARNAGYLPLTMLTYSAKDGFPEIETQMQHLLEDRDTLSQLVDEWTLFATVHEKDRSLLRSRWYDPTVLLHRLEDLQREPHIFTAADGYDPQRRFFISDDEIDRILRGSERSYESRLDAFSFFSRNTDTKERERFLKQQHGEYSGYHGGNDNQTYTSAGLSFSHGSLGAPYAQVELKWPAITKRVSDMISMGRFLYPSDAEKMADYEVKQLAKLVMNFFRDTPNEYARPTEKSIFDYWDGVADIQGQLSDPERVREIYETMMLPLWNATLLGDRSYQERERGMEAMQAYQAGTFSVFGRDHTLRPLSGLSQPEKQQKMAPNADLDAAKELIDQFCSQEYGSEADFSDLQKVSVAYTTITDDAIPVEVYVNLIKFRLDRYIEGVIVDSRQYSSLKELTEQELVNLDFDELVSFSREQLAKVAIHEVEILLQWDSGGEQIQTWQYSNGWFYNHYGIEDGVASSVAGPFDTLEDAKTAVLVQRPLAVEVSDTRDAEDTFDDIDPEQIRENLAQRGIINGEVVDPEALNNGPFIQQVVADAAAAQEPAAPIPPQPKPKRERITFEPLHPEIPREQRTNFRINDPELGYGTASEKYAANVAAIRMLKRIEDEGRLATPVEQEILSWYVGWGGLADCFDEKHSKYQELKALLSEEEYTAARASSLTAFYTSPVIIQAMYQALEQMGFREGNILEPSCGVGNFIGMIPGSMAGSHAYGVELDSISGRISQQLYQNSSIAVTGFEKVQMPDSFFDVAIGNVPFGDFKVLDKRYDKHHWLIHDYFFGKTLDKVRPGGIVAFITSKGTMDKENSAVRKYLAQRADLIGAIRLPNTAFKRNAGTEVTSDILFLQKRDRMTDIEPDWVHLDTDANGIRMNSYFVQHPDMILGEMVMESTRFGMDSVCRADENAGLSELLQGAISNIHAQITEYQHEELEEEDNSIPADPNVRNFSYTIVDGKVYFRENSRMNAVEVSVTAENRIRGMIALRDCVRRLIDYQTEGYPDEDIQKEQAQLNTLYDEYTKKYGLLSSRGNSLAFGEDSSYFLLCSLEVLDEEGNFKRKADMFTKRTIRPHVAVTSVDTASEALAVSIAEKARVDMSFMAELSGKTEQELETELEGVIFRDVNCAERKEEIPLAFVDLERYAFVTADEYLSGNVRRKLRMVKALQEVLSPEKRELLSRNIEALTAVQPIDLTAGEVGVRIGVNWVPKEIYEQFLYEVIGTSAYARYKIKVLYSPHSGEWNVTNKSFDGSNIKAITTYGTKRINAYHIFEQTLNQKDVRIYDTKIDANGNEVRVLNKKETAIAQDRQELIKAKFTEWIWKDIDRRERLCGIYNETFNAIRPREYDGQHIRFSSMNPEITLRKHQINAIAHIMYGGNTLLAHEVGAGKTFEIVAAAMESKRLGLCTKSLIVVPNHITEQWAAEWLQLYPSANILVATKKDFETKNRKKFCARIATGDYDAIIIGHSQFEKIPMSRERQEIILRRQIDSILDGIREAKRNHAENYSIKQMERTRKSLENRLAKLNDQSRKDDVVTFEQLGVDRIFVDESHYFKNLFLATKMRNVGGISQTEAQKSSDLFMKCQYLDEITGNRGVIFATGTPISNSMVELYTIQRYLQYSTLEEMGLLNFDDWAANYGETVTAIELSPEGSGYRSKTRFAKFYNLPELMATFKMVADIQTADMLKLPVPKANFHTEVIKPSPMQEDMIKSLADRAEEIRAGRVNPSVDNMLRITNDGRKLALDMRLINPLAPDSDTIKTSICARNVFSIWERTQEQRSTQLVFCDLSTPRGDGSFNFYDDLKAKLVAKGIPPEEIAYIHEANTEVRKKELFSKVRSGQVRVLIGSTAKMGAGTNCQDKLIALHDADCPWRPSDLAQRLGRIVRQGNQNPEVEIFRYVTENTFDAYLYQLVENKQKFIAQIMTSKAPARIADDVDETALSYSEIKALATGNPLIIEKCNLDVEVSKLNMLKANHLNQRFALENLVLRKYPADIAKLTEAIAGYEKDVATAQAHPKPAEGFIGMEIKGTHYSEKEAAGRVVINACTELQGSDAIPLGQYRGFTMSLQYDAAHTDYKLTMKGAMSHTISLGADIFGNITRMDNLVDGLAKELDGYRTVLQDTRTQLANAKAEMETPFAKEAELTEKSARLKELNILLNIDQKDKALLDEAPEDSPDKEKSRSVER